MKEGWKLKPFEKCLEKVVYTTKLQGKDYLKDGLYPIVSQEECMISGYWNRTEDVFHIKKPIVVFGDHTRIVKYIDFDFVLGADGVKILCPIDELDAKFLSYYLIWYKIPNLGYSRHYKILKEIELPIPPLSEQQQIVEELDLLSGIIEKKKEQLKELDNLAQSIFYEMFGDPVANEKGWGLKKASSILNVIGGYAFKSDKFSNVGIPVLRIGNINSGIFKSENLVFWEYDSSLSRYEIMPGDVVLSLTGTVGKDDYGNICILGNEYPKYYLNQRNAKFELSEDIDKIYLAYLFKYDKFKRQLTDVSRGVRQANISNKDILNLFIPTPPLPLQQSFASKIEAIEKQKALIKQSITETETLFNSRMDYYFG